MSEASRGHVLIAGVTTRAFAVSASRAGYRVTAIDGFGDLDLRAAAEVIVARPAHPGVPYGPCDAAASANQVRAKLAAYTSNFENYPRAVGRLARGRRLLGNTPQTLVRVRNPLAVARVLQEHGLTGPETRSRAPVKTRAPTQWLMKPRRSGGGHGIEVWAPGRRLPRTMYLQQQIAGIPGSISFAADGYSAVVLGFSRQLVGDVRVGARRFRYSGSLLGNKVAPLFPRQTELLKRAEEVAAIITREFRLIGLNGIDFVARSGVPYPVEVNPRYSASMELIERAHATSLFQIHVDACRGLLPPTVGNQAMLYGKAIVFARRDALVPKTSYWIRESWMADIPAPGDRVQGGRPICTVFASARSAGACRRLLWRRAAWVYRNVNSRRGGRHESRS